MLWKGLTTRGAFIGGWVGLISAVALTIVSPGIWEAVFGFPKGSALFPYTSPAIFTIPLAFLCCWVFSITDASAQAKKEQAAFEAQYVRSQTGIGAEGGGGALRHFATTVGAPLDAGRLFIGPRAKTPPELIAARPLLDSRQNALGSSSG